MKACLAYIVASRKRKEGQRIIIYDYSSKTYRYFHFDKNKDNFSRIYDYMRRSFVNESPKGYFFDNEEKVMLHLEEYKENIFRGFNHKTNSYFVANVKNGDISIYDYGESEWYRFHAYVTEPQQSKK